MVQKVLHEKQLMGCKFQVCSYSQGLFFPSIFAHILKIIHIYIIYEEKCYFNQNYWFHVVINMTIIMISSKEEREVGCQLG